MLFTWITVCEIPAKGREPRNK